jgi:lycopene cyclase domain-containing protein
MPAEYLLLMAACVAITLPLEFVLGARVYRRPRRLVLSLLPVLVVFYVWDALAIARGHWDYSPAHTTGWLLPFAVPVEEVVFFIVIPLCGLLTFEAVGRMLGRRRGAARSPSEPSSQPRSRNVPSLPEFREQAHVPGAKNGGPGGTDA